MLRPLQIVIPLQDPFLPQSKGDPQRERPQVARLFFV